MTESIRVRIDQYSPFRCAGFVQSGLTLANAPMLAPKQSDPGFWRNVTGESSLLRMDKSFRAR